MTEIRPGTIAARRGAFTLTEVLVSIAATGTLMVGLGSTVYLVSQTSTRTNRPVTEITASSLSLDELGSELHYATNFVERSNRAVEFTIADRTGDGISETIRYAWSGVSGDPVTRTVNGGASKIVRDDVNHFQLAYTVQTKQEIPEGGDSPPVAATEQLAASFDGWSGITASTRTFLLNTGCWASEYFELPWPAGATSFRVTRVRLKLGQSAGTGQFTVGVYTAAGGTGPLPSTTLLGTQQTVSTSGLPVTPDWKEFAFSDVTMTNTTSGYNIVVKGTVAGGKLQYLQAASAPQDANVMKYTSNSGGSWSPSASLEKINDVQYEVYGIFEGGASEPTLEPIDRHFVRAVNITLQTGPNAANSVQTAVDILNTPEVAAP